jgi:hypothetical protein
MRLRVLAGVLLAGTLVSGYTLVAEISGREVFGRFGDAVCGLDFNHDGRSDIVVGEPGWNNVYIFLGGAPFDTAPDLVFRGTAGTYFGSCLAPIGDLNGDGIDDLAIGAPRDNTGGAAAGRVFIHFGSSNPDTIADMTLTGHVAAGRFGQAIDGGFDVNGDSGTDLLVGAPGDQHAYLFLGGDRLDTLPDLTLRAGNGDYFGGAVALFGGEPLDTLADILVGDYRHSGSILHGGGVFLYRGADPPDPGLDQVWEGDEQNRQLGVTLCGPGDLNGDSRADLAFGGSYTATVDLHWGDTAVSGPPDLRLTGQRRFGSWIAGRADANADGFADLLVGADGDDLGVPTGPGYAYLFLGGDSMSATPDTVLAGEADEDMFGSCLAFCGDVNDDDRVEFAVGAPGHDSRGSNAGRVYVYSSDWTGIAAPPEPTPSTVLRATPVFRSACIINARPGASIDVFDIAGARRARLRADQSGCCRWSPGFEVPPGVYILRAGIREYCRTLLVR